MIIDPKILKIITIKHQHIKVTMVVKKIEMNYFLKVKAITNLKWLV
jgi:hypothetical protein